MIVEAEALQEISRLGAVETCGILSIPQEIQFSNLIFTAAQLLRAPMAMLAIVCHDQIWLNAKAGLLPSDWPRLESFCNTVIENKTPLVVEDTTKSVKFSRLPVVVEHPRVRFYAGVPIHGPDNDVVATFCVLDRQPRIIQDRPYQQLLQLARDAESILKQRGGYA